MKIDDYVSLKGLRQDGLSKDDWKWLLPLFVIIIVGSAIVFKL